MAQQRKTERGKKDGGRQRWKWRETEKEKKTET